VIAKIDGCFSETWSPLARVPSLLRLPLPFFLWACSQNAGTLSKQANLVTATFPIRFKELGDRKKEKPWKRHYHISNFFRIGEHAFTIDLLLLVEKKPEQHELTALNGNCGINYLGQQLQTLNVFNRLFPSYLVPLFQNKSSCKTFHMKVSLICIKKEPVGGTDFHMNGCAWRFVLTQVKCNSEMAN